MLLKTILFAGIAGVAVWMIQDPVAQEQEKEAVAEVQEEAESAAAVLNLEGVKCCVAGEKGNASAEHSVAWREGNVYFCCADCVAAFEKDPEAFSTQANHQLVVTGQYEQKGCPFSGGDLAEDSKLAVGGVEVGFCCDDCKGKVGAETDPVAQAKLVFGNEAFEKGFAKKASTVAISSFKCFFMKKKDLNEEKFVEFNGGKVYFCCDGCVKRFNKDPDKYAVMANHQLVQTGQYKQTACPMSGGKVDESKTAEVNGVKVAFCCGNCQAKAEAAEEEARAEMIFNAEAFAKAFSKQ